MDATHRGLWPWPGVGLLGLVLAALVGLGCSSGTSTPAPSLPPPPPPYTGPPYFKDMTPGSGVDHTYRNGQDKGHLAIIESLGGGCALIDYDGDGLLDVVFTGGGD